MEAIKKIIIIITAIFLSNGAFAQKTYTFNGNGKWSDSSNWLNKTIPPPILDSGASIIINPLVNGECILDTLQLIAFGATLTIQQGKKFRIIGDLKSTSNPSSLITGKVILPNGSPINVNSCKVVAKLDVSSVTNSGFTIDTSGNNLSAVFLTDQNEQIIMMKYLYNGQQDNDLTAQSTALGLFMSLPSVQSLTDSAKLALLPQISATPEFTLLVDEVTNKVKSGGSFADGQDSTLNAALSKMFDKATALKVFGIFDDPISIYSAGNQVSVVNNGTANIYGVGLYKDGQLVGNIQTLGGYDYLPTSLGDIVKHIYSLKTNSVIEEPKSLDFNLTAHGEYTLKIRSGGKIGDNTAEATIALRYNLIKGAMNIIALYVPEIKQGQCIPALIGKLLSFISNIYSLSQIQTSSPTALAQIMLNSASYLVTSSGDIIQGCVPEKKIQNSYFKILEKFFFYVNVVGAANAAINSSIIGYQLQNAKPIVDTCFRVTNGKITSCITVPTLITTSVTSITGVSAISGGNILSDGGSPIVARGVCWSTEHNPTISLTTKTNEGSGTGNFLSNINGLSASTTYYVKAYATNSAGTAYGNEISLRTLSSLEGTTRWRGYVTYSNGDAPRFGELRLFTRGTDCSATFWIGQDFSIPSFSYTQGVLNADETVITWSRIDYWTPTGCGNEVNPFTISGNNLSGSWKYYCVNVPGMDETYRYEFKNLVRQ